MKIELTKNQAETIASLAVFADNPRKSWTPVLTEIAITITEGKLTATATDRFCLMTYTAELEEPVTAEFRLTNDLAKFIKSNLTKKTLGGVTITLGEEGSVTVEIAGGVTMTSGYLTTAKFPAVLSLLEGWSEAAEAATLTLNAEFLAKLAQIKLNGEKQEKWNLTPGLNKNNPNRPGPLKATAGESLSGLIQPNLVAAA